MLRLLTFTLYLCLTAFSLPTSAAGLSFPAEVTYDNSLFQLSSRYRIGTRLFHKYTTEANSTNEKKSQDQEVIIQFAPDFYLKDAEWAYDIRGYFESFPVRPLYDISDIGGVPIARHLTRPDGRVEWLESSVMLFFPDACSGQVVFQHIKKIPVQDADLARAWAQNNAMALDLLKKLTWKPQCLSE